MLVGLEIERNTRSRARETAAELAYRFVSANGLWIDLKDAGVVPRLEDSINKLQEQYQKKYLQEPALYEFSEWLPDMWRCDCECGGVAGHGKGREQNRGKEESGFHGACESA